MTARRLHIAFVLAAAVWAALLVVAPFLASRPHASTFGAALTLAVYAVGSGLCHQLPERSFHVWAAQMPVCARCAGIYFGAAMTAVLGAGARGFQPSDNRSPKALVLQKSRLIVALAALPSAATLVFEWSTGHTPANWIRFAAGLPLGVAVAWLVRSAAENQVN
jgi:uncharacterized membrane protein